MQAIAANMAAIRTVYHASSQDEYDALALALKQPRVQAWIGSSASLAGVLSVRAVASNPFYFHVIRNFLPSLINPCSLQ